MNQAPHAVENVSTPTPEMPRRFHFYSVYILGFIVLIFILTVIIGGYWFGWLSVSMPTPVITCPEDLRDCPNGTHVGRILPNCAFAPCPVTQPIPTINMSDWKTYINEKYTYSIKYPPKGKITVGNEGIPTLPDDAIHIQNEDYGIITIAVEDITDTDKYTSRSFKEASYNSPITYTDVVYNTLSGKRAEFIQEYVGGYQNKITYTFFPVGKRVYYLLSTTLIDPKTGKLLRPEDEEQMKFYNQILSTFKFTDQTIVSVSPTSDNTNQSIRTITYQKNSAWVDFTSATGYSFQYPSGWQDSSKKGEQLIDNKCSFCVGNGVGGVLCADVVPYDGGSRRALVSTSGYSIQYEDVYIQGVKSLLVERGPLLDSGSGTHIIVPKGSYALIITWGNRGKDSEIVNTLLQSIYIPSELDITKCPLP